MDDKMAQDFPATAMATDDWSDVDYLAAIFLDALMLIQGRLDKLEASNARIETMLREIGAIVAGKD